MKVHILKQLRDNAMVEKDSLLEFNLRKTADDLQVAIRNFSEMPSEQNLSRVTGLWARAVRYLCLSEPEPDGPAPGTSVREPERLAA